MSQLSKTPTSSSSSRARSEPDAPFCGGFDAPPWCRNPHLQTLLPRLRVGPALPLRRERLELPDGDFVDLDWAPRAHGPIVIVLHGLEGSSRSPYMRGILHALDRQGFRAVAMHFRGCSGIPNRLPRSYHSGETRDFDHVVRTLQQREPETRLAAVGYSLGGNVLLKWLGEEGANAPVQSAVAVSVPFVLSQAADRLDRGVSRLYQWKLLLSLRQSLRRKFAQAAPPFPLRELGKLRSFWTFDDQITAPLHGFRGAVDYYNSSSSRQFLQRITVPTLIIHAKDDPFLPAEAIPTPEEFSPSTRFELYAHGGHVGFIAGPSPWRPVYWLEHRIPEFLAQHLVRASAPRTAAGG